MSNTPQTKAQKLIEIAKCIKDPVYAIENYLETFDQTQKGYVRFKLFPKQKELIKAYKDERFNIVMKPRQAGVSTTTAAYIAVMSALSDPNNPQRILILANKQETAIEFLKKVKDFTSQIPTWMNVWSNNDSWFDSEKNSAKHYRLTNGSEVKAVATSMDALRGYTPSLLVMDEAAYIEGGDEVYAAAQPALSTGGRAILISTPNGMDQLYYKTYMSAKTKEKTNNPFNIVEMRWFQDPRYNVGMRWQKKNDAGEVIDELVEMDYAKFQKLEEDGWYPTAPWFEKMCAQLNNNPRTIAQELLCAFNGSGDNVIDNKYIEYQTKHNVKDPIKTEWLDGNMWIWEDPILGHEYILAADAASGSADDFATICIYDFTTGNQVAEYHGKTAPDILGEISFEYGNRYEAFIVVDITGGYGISTVLKLIELGYSSKKMYYDVVLGIDSVTNNKSLEKHMRDGKLPGLNFQKNRNTIITKLEEAVRLNSFKVRSIRSVTEMNTFVFKNGRPDHMKGYHDDCLKSDTLIKTIDGYKEISDIKPGELVLTHLGNYKPVEKILRKPFNGDWYDFKFSGQIGVGMSYNHPLYSAEHTNNRNSDKKKSERSWLMPQEWLDKKNKYKDGNYLPRQISIIEKLKPNENKTIYFNDIFGIKHSMEQIKLNQILLDSNFAKFLGLFLADGHSFKENNRNGNKYGVIFSFHERDLELIEEIKSYVESFNISVTVTHDKTKSYTLKFNNKLIWGLMNSCYDDNREKVLPYYSKHLGQDLKYTLEYWLKGDAWKPKRGDYDYIGCTTSKKLVLSMRDITWSLGYYSQIRFVTRKRYGKTTKNQYWLHLRKDCRKTDNLKKISDFEYGTKTVKIEKSNYNGYVYNLQVSDDESFVANGIVVHNCLMAIAMCCYVAQTSFKDLEKSKGQTKAMLDSWVVSTQTSESVDALNTSEYNAIVNREATAKQVQPALSEHNWIFMGMTGFKDKEKNKKITRR